MRLSANKLDRRGSVKANIGHLEGASGIAGIIKTIMVLEKGVIPANANLNNLNSKIDADYLRLEVREFLSLKMRLLDTNFISSQRRMYPGPRVAFAERRSTPSVSVALIHT